MVGPWYLLDEPFPSLALVRVVRFGEDYCVVAQGVMRIIEFFCDNCIPHNVFCTLAEKDASSLRVIIYPRDGGSDALAKSKELSGFNIACLEPSGFVVVGSKYY